MTKTKIETPSYNEAKKLSEMLKDRGNQTDILKTETNTFYVILNEDIDAMLDILTSLVDTLPWYLGQGDALNSATKQTISVIKQREARAQDRINEATNGLWNTARTFQPHSDPLATSP